MSALAITWSKKMDIVEKKIVEITLGGKTIRYEIVGGKIIRRTYPNGRSNENLHVRIDKGSLEQLAPISVRDPRIDASSAIQTRASINTIFIEDFERVGHEVPGQYWDSFDTNSAGGYVSWADVYRYYGFKAYEGNWSMWCAGFINDSTISGTVKGDGLPSILVVDDNNVSNYKNYAIYYTDPLDYWGYSYDYWNTSTSGAPSAATLSNYDIVIWFTGDDYQYTLTATERDALSTYLDGGGSLFISGQDIGYDVYYEDPTWYQNYLKAIYEADDTNAANVTGAPGTAFDGDTYVLNGADSAQNSNYPSNITNTSGSYMLFYYNSSRNLGAAVYYDGAYKLVYFAFPFEAMGNTSERRRIMYRLIENYLTPNPRYDIGRNDSYSWWGVLVYLRSGTAYKITLDWNSTEDLDLLIFNTSGDLYAYSLSNKPEVVEFEANQDGWWYIIVDDWSDSLNVGSSITITINQTVYMKRYYTPLDVKYANYMDSYAYWNSTFYPVDNYDLLALEFWGWWNLEDTYDKFSAGFYMNNGSAYLLSFDRDSAAYASGYTVHEKYFSYRIIEKTADNWLRIGLVADKDFYDGFNITPIFRFYSDLSTVDVGAYVDLVKFYEIDITLDDTYINTTLAHPGESVEVGWYVSNPSVFNITEFNLSVTFQHVDTGQEYVYFLPVNLSEYYKVLQPGSSWFYALISSSHISNMPTGYYNVLYEVWSGTVGKSRLWGSSGWIYNGFQIKHYTSVSFSQSQYSGYYGDSLTITGYIEDADTKSSLSGKNVSLYYYDGSAWVYLGSAISDTNGNLQWTITLTMDAGTYDLMIEFKGDDDYEASSRTLTNGLVVDPEITTISFDQAGYSVQYGDSLTISCVLTDDEGNPLSSKPVDFYYSSDGQTWTYWFNAYTDTNGRASKNVVVDLDPGDYYIKAQFAGDKNYQSSSAQTTLTVDQEVTQITLDSDNYTVDYLDPLTLTATLKDDDGQNVDGKMVYFEYYNGSAWVPLGNSTTSNGVASITIYVDLKPQTYTIRAIFYGDKQYTSSSDTATLTVNKETTSLTDPSTSGHYLDYVTISTTLTEDGNPLGGFAIDFYVNNTYVGSNKTGKDGVAVFDYLIDLIPGTYPLSVKFQGNDYYEASSAQGSLAVYKEITVLSDPSTTGTYSDSATIGSTLTDDEGNPLASKLLTFSIYVGGSWVDLGSNTTDKNGYAYVVFTVDWPSGNYSVKVYFAGDTYYEQAEQSGVLTVYKEKTAISDPSTSGYYSDNATSVVYLTDDEKNPISNVQVSFDVYYGGSWVNLGSNTTNDNGEARLEFLIDIPYGVYDLNVSFAGNEYYEGTYTIGSLTVYKEITNLSDPSTSGYYSDNITITTYLLTDDKEPVVGRTVVFSIYINGSWSDLGNSSTQTDGRAELTITLGYQPNNYTIRVSFAGDQYYDTCEATGQLTIYKEKTVLSDPSTAGYYSDYVTISTTLTDDESIGIGNKLVVFEILIDGTWQTLGSNTTDTDGSVFIRILLNYTPSTYDLRVSFNGDDYYEQCQSLGSLTVRKELTTIVVFKAEGNYSDSILLVAKLTDDEGTPLENLTVSFNVSSDNISWVLLGEAQTNASGYANLNYVIDLPYGNYTLKAYFAGNSYYEASLGYSKLRVHREMVIVILDKSSYTVNYSDTLEVLVRLVDNEGTSISNTNVYLNASSAMGDIFLDSGTTNSSGYVTIAVKIDLVPSNYTLVAYHRADDYYLYGESRAQLSVSKEQTLVINVSGIGRYGDNDAILEAWLVDNENSSIEQRTLEFYLYNSSSETWEYLGSNSTDSDGRAIIRTALSLPFGEYDLNVSFAGDQYYEPSSGTGTLLVDKEITVILGPNDASGKYGSQITITLRLVDDENETYISGAEIEFLFWNGTDNESLGTKITNSSGYVDITLNLTHLPATYSLYAIYRGNQYYYGVQKEVSIIIEKLLLSITTPNGSGNYSDTIEIGVNITDEYGNKYNGSVLLELNESGKWVVIAKANSTDGYALFVFVANITPGTYSIRARVPETAIYSEGVSDLGTLDISKEASRIEVTLNSTYEYSDELVVYMVLLDDEGEPIQNRTIVVTFCDDSFNVTTGVDGGAKFSIPLFYRPGNYSLDISFDGDSYYVDCSYSTTIRVVAESTNIKIYAESYVFVGKTIEIVIYLLDNDGASVPNRTVMVYVNGTYVANITTGDDGAAKYVYQAPNTSGEVEISFVFAGDNLYNSSEACSVIKILSTYIEILTNKSSYSTNYSDELIIPVTILNYTGEPILGTDVVLLINVSGDLMDVARAKTDDAGKVTLVWVATIKPGVYNAYLVCESLSGYEGYSKRIQITIGKESTVITCPYENIRAEYTDYFSISSYLLTDDGEPIAGETLWFYLSINGTEVKLGSAVTNPDGQAEITVKCDFLLGNYNVVVVYGGSDYYQEANRTLTLVVEPEKIEILNIVITPEKLVVGDELVIAITVGENDENIVYVAGAKASMFINGTRVDVQTTDVNGKAEFRWVPRSPGVYLIRIVVEKDYYEQTSLTIRRTVYGALRLIPVMLIVPAIAAILLVAYMVRKRRKRHIAQLQENS